MARPSYLGRREGARYLMQIRPGKPSAALYGAHSARVVKDGGSRRGAETVDGRLGLGSGTGAATDLERSVACCCMSALNPTLGGLRWRIDG
jgi:hypothetical protein